MWKRIMKIVLGLMILLLFSAPYFIWKNEIKQLSILGFLGLFLACLISNLSILIPSSSTMIVLAASTVLNPMLCILIGAAGAMIGELSSYFVGYVGKGVIQSEKKERFVKLQTWFRKNTFLNVFIFSLVPLPIFDLAGLIAGNERMNLVMYMLAGFLGKLMKYALFYAVLSFLIPYFVRIDLFGMGDTIERLFSWFY